MIDLFVRQKQLLRIMGHHFAPDKSLLLSIWCNILYFGFPIVLFLAQWPLLNHSFHYIDKVELATASLRISFASVLTVIKIITFVSYKYRFVALMRKLEAMYFESNDFSAMKILETANNKVFFMVKLYWIFVSNTALSFMLIPIFKIVWSKVTKADLVLELPMPMRFPFDVESIPGYGFAYICSGLAALSVATYAVAIDGLFLSFIINVVSHFKILQKSIMDNTFIKKEKDLHFDLKSYVEYHNLIFGLYNELREIYSPIVFGVFLMTSLQVCFILYQIMKLFGNVLELVSNLLFLIAILCQLFIYCYGGEILKFESQMVGISVQLSNWYNLKPSHRRMLLLMMLRSQREAIIKGGFYEASLANFMTILKGAVSYIALMQSIE